MDKLKYCEYFPDALYDSIVKFLSQNHCSQNETDFKTCIPWIWQGDKGFKKGHGIKNNIFSLLENILEHKSLYSRKGNYVLN